MLMKKMPFKICFFHIMPKRTLQSCFREAVTTDRNFKTAQNSKYESTDVKLS